MQKIKNQKGRVPLIVLGAIVFLLVGIGSGYVVSKKTISVSKCTTGVIEKGGFVSKCGAGAVERKEQEEEIKGEKKEEKKNEDSETADWKIESLEWVEFKIPEGWGLLNKNEDQGFVLNNLNNGRTFSFYKNVGRGGPSTEYLVKYAGEIEDGKIILSNRELIATDAKSEFFKKGSSAIVAAIASNGDNFLIIDEGIGNYEIAEKTFLEIVENIHPLTDQVADWKAYNNEKYGFEMKYPKEFIQKEIENTIIFKDEKRGYISIFVMPEKLDLKNIQGLYGKIENPILVKVGNKDGYQHRDGDAGCEAQIVQTDLDGEILNIAFGSCTDDVNPKTNPVSQDQNLINQVLSSFKFTK